MPKASPSKVVAYLSDITAQRQEAMLNAAFRGALNQLDANVMVADNELKIIFVNPAAAQMLARAAGRLPPRPAELRRQRNAGREPGVDDARIRPRCAARSNA